MEDIDEIEDDSYPIQTMEIDCDICGKTMRRFNRCSNCSTNWCGDCKHNYWRCSGSNHTFIEECCDNCFPPHGRIVDGHYYCSFCAPDTEILEKKFKDDSWRFQREITLRDSSSRCLDLDYLNNSENWKRYQESPDRVKQEWEKRMTS